MDQVPGPYIGISHDFQVSTGTAPDVEPPDTAMAAGPTFLTEVVNQTIAVYTKAGTPVAFENLNIFYGVSPNAYAMIEPRIVYDPTTNRWFTSSLGFDPAGNPSSIVRVAVSMDSSPSRFFVYQFYSNSTTICDRPTLAYSADKVSFSCNEFTSSGFSQTQTYFINKSEMEAGGTTHFNSFTDSGTHFSIVPAVNLDPNGGVSAVQYLIYNGSDRALFPKAPLSPVIGVFAAVRTPHGLAGDVNLFEMDLTLPSTAPPPAARQPGGLIETDDSRFESAVWQNNSLWLTGNDSCNNFGTQACARLVKVSTTDWNRGISGAPLVAQDLDILGSPGLAFYYPAVTVNSGGEPNRAATPVGSSAV